MMILFNKVHRACIRRRLQSARLDLRLGMLASIPDSSMQHSKLLAAGGR